MTDEEKRALETFLKECKLAGFTVRMPTYAPTGLGTVSKDPSHWVGLHMSSYPFFGIYRLTGDSTYNEFDTVEELIEAAEEEIREWT